MVLNGIIARYNLEDWYKKTFTPKEKNFLNLLLPNLFSGTYQKEYSAALALATTVVSALDLPNEAYFKYRKINARVQEKNICKILSILDDSVPLIEQYIIYNILIYYTMRHQGIFIDNERAVSFSERQLKIFEKVQETLNASNDKYSEFDVRKNYGYDTLYKIYERKGNKDKILELFEKVKYINANADLDSTIMRDDGLINAYCKKAFKNIFRDNPQLFIHTALATLKYPKSMKTWIECLSCTDKTTSNFITIENPTKNLKSYSNYIGIVLNSPEPIEQYVAIARKLFSENEVHVSPRNAKGIIIKISEKNVKERKNIFNNPTEIVPWCHYYAALARYLNQNEFEIDLNTIVANCMYSGDFEFLKITDEFQQTFNTFLKAIDAKYFMQIPVAQTTSSESFSLNRYSEKDVKEYLKENATDIIEECWHSLSGVFYGNDIFDFIPSDCLSDDGNFANERKIKDIFSDKFESQTQYFSTISFKKTAKIDQYMQSAKTLFQNHEIQYKSEKSQIYISIEKEDFDICEITDTVIDQMLEESADILKKVKAINAHAFFADEYIDLQSCSEYILSCNSVLIATYKKEFFEKLSQFVKSIDKNDFAELENANVTRPEKSDIHYSLSDKIDFNADSDFLTYKARLKDKFLESFYSIVYDYWDFFQPDFWVKDYENMSPYLFFPKDFHDTESPSMQLLYEFEEVAEQIYGDEKEKFEAKIESADNRSSITKNLQKFSFGINLSYITLEYITEIAHKVFEKHPVKIFRKKKIAVVEIEIDFSDFAVISDKEKLEISFAKHLAFVKLAYTINKQAETESRSDFIDDDSLLFTIAYNESRYLLRPKSEFYDKLEDFFYAIGKEKFVEKYDSEEFYMRNF